MALALLLCLAACGQQDPACGSYLYVGAEALGLSVPGEGSDVLLTLGPNGRGTLQRGESRGAFSWRREGETLLLEMNGRLYDGRFAENGQVLLQTEDGTCLRFSREATPAEQTEESDWYGWWELDNSTGRMPPSWRDCCASLENTPFGPELRLWDEDGSRDEPLALVQLRRDGESLVSVSGFFLLEDLEDGAWRLDPGGTVLELRGIYTHGEESFSYHVVLRPWGAKWIEEGRRPFRYLDWYLPLLEQGESMPQRIG